MDAAGWANQIDSALLLLKIGVIGSPHLWTPMDPNMDPSMDPLWTPYGPPEHNLFVVGTVPHIYNKIHDIGSVQHSQASNAYSIFSSCALPCVYFSPEYVD